MLINTNEKISSNVLLDEDGASLLTVPMKNSLTVVLLSCKLCSVHDSEYHYTLFLKYLPKVQVFLNITPCLLVISVSEELEVSLS